MNPREMLVQIIKAKKLNPDEILKSDAQVNEEMAKRAQQGKPVDPVKQQELQLKAQELQLKQQDYQRQKQHDDQNFQLEQLKIHQRQQEAGERRAVERELGFARIALDREISLEKLYKSLGLEEKKINTTRQVEGVKAMNVQDEMNLKRQTGQGI